MLDWFSILLFRCCYLGLCELVLACSQQEDSVLSTSCPDFALRTKSTRTLAHTYLAWTPEIYGKKDTSNKKLVSSFLYMKVVLLRSALYWCSFTVFWAILGTYKITLKVVLWSKNHFLFFFRFWKCILLTSNWQNFELCVLSEGCLFWV